MDFNPISTRSTLINESQSMSSEFIQDPSRNTIKLSSAISLSKQQPIKDEPISPFYDKKLLESPNSFSMNQEDFSPSTQNDQKNEKIDNQKVSLLEYQKLECLLKKRLSSIAELRESDSYHDQLKTIKGRIIEDKIVLETSNEYISERNSVCENENANKKNTPPKSNPKKHLEDILVKSTPIITSETQAEIYKTLNLDQCHSGFNILKELEMRKTAQDRGVTMSFNLEKASDIEIEHKKYNADDNFSAKSSKKKKIHKSYKTFQNFNYSANAAVSILKEDPLKKIDQEYEEEELLNSGIFMESLIGSVNENFNARNKISSSIRVKNLEIFKEANLLISKSIFTASYVFLNS